MWEAEAGREACSRPAWSAQQQDSVLVYELGKWVKTKPDNLSLTSKTYTVEGTRGDVSTTEVNMEIQSTCDRTGDSLVCWNTCEAA